MKNLDLLSLMLKKIDLTNKIKEVREQLEDLTNIWDWDEEVDLINISRVEFIGDKSSIKSDTISIKESRSTEQLDMRQDKSSCTVTRQLKLSELLT